MNDATTLDALLPIKSPKENLRCDPRWLFVSRFFAFFSDALDLMPSPSNTPKPPKAKRKRHSDPDDDTLTVAYRGSAILEFLLMEEARADRLAIPFFRLCKLLSPWRHLNLQNWFEAGLGKEYARRHLGVPVPGDKVQEWTLTERV